MKSAAPPGESWSLEVQIHPSDIRKRVRYLFLTRAQLTAASLVALVYLLGLALGAAVAPGVLGGYLNRQEYQTLITERTLQGERLQTLVDRAGQLDGRIGELDRRMGKILLAYGLPFVQVPRRPAVPSAAPPGPPSVYARTIEQGDLLRSDIRRRLMALDASIGQARQFETAHPDEVRRTPSLCPLRDEFVLISSFGRRRSPFTRELEFHDGVDLAAPLETPVYATADGVVAFAGESPVKPGSAWWRYGNLVLVENGDSFVTVYGHNSQNLVRAGQRIQRGDRLATVGTSGRTTSPHLHYEIRRKGADGVYRPVDPLIYILDRHWPNEDRLLLRARSARPVQDFEPLPPSVGGRPGRK
ncbi:MAG TPA: M23 family metallopeptidase [Thermoanaerobaculia bacterium]|nr:M23 family metallopeptidase [Thermoanaerobaculia bacterium]